MVTKLIGLGFKAYLYDPYNIFDAVIMGLSTIDSVTYILTEWYGFASNSAAHSVLLAIRTFRLLRIFKLANTWKRFNDLLKTVWKTLQEIAIFSLLLLLFNFIFALIGVELFAYSCKVTVADIIDMENGFFPLNNFNNFQQAFLSVFVLLTGDGWSSIMMDYARSAGLALTLTFFIAFMILGQYLLFNLFLAILLQNFDEDSIEQEI